MVVWSGQSKLGEASDDNASGDDGQVGCQGAIPAKTAKSCEVFFDPGQEDFRHEIVTRVRRDLDIASGSGVIHDMDDESQESVGEFLPSGRVFCQALVEQIAIEIGESHGGARKRGRTVAVRWWRTRLQEELLNIR